MRPNAGGATWDFQVWIGLGTITLIYERVDVSIDCNSIDLTFTFADICNVPALEPCDFSAATVRIQTAP